MQTTLKSRLAQAVKIPPGTLCPFLYQTRTITSQSSRTPPPPSTPPRHEDTTLTFLQQKGRDVETRRASTESTLTSSEREVFKNIMKNFGAKIDGITPLPQPSTSESIQHQGEHLKRHETIEASAPPSSLPTSTLVRNTNIDDILSIFAPAETNERFSIFADETTASTTSESTPQRIRQAALQSLHHISTSLTSALTSTTNPPDLAVWRVLETDVFPLINLLQTNNHPSSPTNPHQRPISSLQPDTLPPSISSLPPNIPTLPLITILYPSATLLALHTYISHLPASGFALALLPKIKSLGPVSYLLAGNVRFFNAQMYLQWIVYSDLRAVSALIGEMKRSGVEHDQGTVTLIEEISAQRRREMEGVAANGGTREWWVMKRQDEGWRSLLRKYRWDLLKEGREESKASEDDNDVEGADQEIR